MNVKEIVEHFKYGKMHPNEIFDMYKNLLAFPPDEVLKEIQEAGIGDAIEMNYITAVQMKKKGTWDDYIEKWEKEKNKTSEERLKEYIKSQGI